MTDAVTAAKNVMKDARTAFSQVAQKKKADRPPKAPASKARRRQPDRVLGATKTWTKVYRGRARQPGNLEGQLKIAQA